MTTPVPLVVQESLKTLFNALADKEHACCSGPSTFAQVDRCLEGCELLLDTIPNIRRRYKRQRNALVPFHNLPKELFHAILLLVLDNPLNPQNTKYYSSLNRLRLISSQWNTVITSTRSLWTYVPIFGHPSPSLVTLITRLSNPLPLDVIIYPSSFQKAKASIQEIVRHSSRWKSLKVLLREPKDLRRILAYPAPNLTSLDIRIPTIQEYFEEDPLFIGVIPRLEQIVLGGVLVPWHAPYLRGVRQMHLSGIDTNPLSFDQLLQILRSTTRLSDLQLLACAIQDRPTATSEHLELSDLRKLDLSRLSPTLISDFMDSISAPSANEVIVSPNMDEAADGIVRLAPLVGSWLSKNIQAVKDLPLKVTLGSDSTIFLWARSRVKVVFEFSEYPEVAPMTRVQRTQICSDLCKAMKPKSSCLRIEVLDSNAKAIRRLLAFEPCLPMVTRLYITESYRAQRENGEKLASSEVLGRPREVGGTLRWLYPMVTKVMIEPFDDADEEILQLVQARWKDGVPRVEPPTPLNTLKIPNWKRGNEMSELQDLAPVMGFTMKLVD